MIEVSVTIRNDESTLTQKHLVYDENVRVSHEDPVLAGLVAQAEKDFGKAFEDVIVKIKYSW